MPVIKDLFKTVSEIRNDLNCQVCQDHARPGKKQWYRCLNFHAICQECRGEKCPCGEPISKEYDRNVEKLLSIENLKFNCINTKNGCKETLTENALEKHESECGYRLVPCLLSAIDGCDEKVTFRDAIQHFKKEHGGKTWDFEDLQGVLTVSSCFEKDLMSGKNYFCTHTQCYSQSGEEFLLLKMCKDKIVYFWVCCLGSPNEVKYYLLLVGPKANAILFELSEAK